MTPELVDQFREQGFCLVKNGLPNALLTQWQQLAEEFNVRGLEAHHRGGSFPGAGIIEEGGQPVMTLYNDISAIDEHLLLTTLACPAILNIAKHIVGQGCVPVSMDLQYKYNYPYNWHQDATVSRDFHYVTVGMYLDDANADDGCVQYLPGSQHSIVDVQKLEQEYGWDIPGHIVQPTQAGDIMVHDSMVLHGSKPKRRAGARRTLYIEFWTRQALTETGLFSRQWLEMRQCWMALILAQDPHKIWPVQWRQDYPDITEAGTLFKDIFEKPEAGMKPNWGTFPVTRDDYPIPADMRSAQT